LSFLESLSGFQDWQEVSRSDGEREHSRRRGKRRGDKRRKRMGSHGERKRKEGKEREAQEA
jgi:hypothetical protein